MFDVTKEILISEKEFTETNYKSLLEALVYIKNNLIDTDVRQFLATESLLKMIKNAFYFILKALFVLKIFKFLF